MCKLSAQHQELEDIYFNAQIDLGDFVRLKLNRNYGMRLSHLHIGCDSVQAKQDGKWFSVAMVEDYHVGTNKRFLSFQCDSAVRLHHPVQVPLNDDSEMYDKYITMTAAYADYIYRDD